MGTPGPAPPGAESARSKAGASDSVGRVKHDARGNAVWNWAVSAGTHALESTSRLLKRLETPELSLEDKPKPTTLELEERDPGGGYDPYSKGGRGGSAGYDPYGRGTKQKKP